MDELQMIGAMLDEAPPPEAAALGRARLEREIGAPERPRAGRRRPRWPLLTGLGVAAAGAALAGTLIVPSGPPDGPSGERPRPAHSLLLAAATRAEGAPATHGRYWSAVTRESGRTIARGHVYQDVREIGLWDAGPGDDAWVAERRISHRVLGAAPPGAPGTSGAPGAAASAGGGAGSVSSGRTPWTKVKVEGGEAYTIAAEGTRPLDVRTLPADARKLKPFLEALRLQAADPGVRGDAAEWLMSNARRIGAAPVSPAVLGATYRVLAGDPRVRAAGPAADVLGRRGQAIVRRVQAGDGALDERLLIDPAIGRLLAHETVLVKAGRAWAGMRPGTVVHSETLVSYGWTDKVPAYPLGKTG